MKSLLKHLFGGKDTKVEPIIEFGRFSDFHKSKSKYDDWDQSLDKHKKQEYIESIKYFLSYINDDVKNNVTIETKNEEKILFKIFQGSKCIEGFANQDGFFAEAKIGKCQTLNVSSLRYLLEENYNLKYSSYALDSSNNLTIVLHTEYLEASPYKLYYGLKEISTMADRKDDVMVAKYSDLEPIINGAIIEISEKEKEIKYQYFFKKISQLLKELEVDTNELKEHPGLISYKILSTVLSIDYLLKPEGMLMEYIENITKVFFQNNSLSPDQKIGLMKKELKKLSLQTKESIHKELYNTKATFGVLTPGNHIRLQEMIDQEMKHFDWYITNGFSNEAGHIPQYIASLILYTYSMPIPEKNLLHLLLRLWNNDFFVDLGFESLMKGDDLDKPKIIDSIEHAIIDKSGVYETPEMNLEEINYSNLNNFSKTYLEAMYKLITKKKD